MQYPVHVYTYSVLEPAGVMVSCESCKILSLSLKLSTLTGSNLPVDQEPGNGQEHDSATCNALFGEVSQNGGPLGTPSDM